jgi:hypothetical protein
MPEKLEKFYNLHEEKIVVGWIGLVYDAKSDYAKNGEPNEAELKNEHGKIVAPKENV